MQIVINVDRKLARSLVFAVGVMLSLVGVVLTLGEPLDTAAQGDGNYSVPFQFVNGQVADADEVNANFQALVDAVNGLSADRASPGELTIPANAFRVNRWDMASDDLYYTASPSASFSATSSGRALRYVLPHGSMPDGATITAFGCYLRDRRTDHQAVVQLRRVFIDTNSSDGSDETEDQALASIETGFLDMTPSTRNSSIAFFETTDIDPAVVNNRGNVYTVTFSNEGTGFPAYPTCGSQCAVAQCRISYAR